MSSTIHLVPFSGKSCDNTVFEDPKQPLFRELRDALAQAGYRLTTTTFHRLPPKRDKVVFFNMQQHYKIYDNLPRFPKENLTLYIWEPPTTQPYCYDSRVHAHFGRIFTIDHERGKQKNHIPFFYPSATTVDPCGLPFDKRTLLTLMSGNKQSPHPSSLYFARMEIIDYFENIETGHFDFYGKGWNGSRYKNYKGFVDNKHQALQKYRFSVCFENSQGINGYITEKIWDCFAAGCIPVYWGPSNIKELIPESCYLHRPDFNSVAEMHDYIMNMDETRFNQYIEAAQTFLHSEKVKPFQRPHFIEQFCAHILTSMN